MRHPAGLFEETPFTSTMALDGRKEPNEIDCLDVLTGDEASSTPGENIANSSASFELSPKLALASRSFVCGSLNASNGRGTNATFVSAQMNRFRIESRSATRAGWPVSSS